MRRFSNSSNRFNASSTTNYQARNLPPTADICEEFHHLLPRESELNNNFISPTTNSSNSYSRETVPQTRTKYEVVCMYIYMNNL